MSSIEARQAPTALHTSAGWWYTLAHQESALGALYVTAAALEDFAEALASAGRVAQAAHLARIAGEVARGEQAERYIWAFRRLGDTLVTLRANHRSDYHAYAQPKSAHEASLDRLYQRFPLVDYPRTTALLFSGTAICDDPRLWADPQPDSLATLTSLAIAPEDWGRYTFCGFRQGVTLARVNANSRWLRVTASALEDVWAQARQDAADFAQRRATTGQTTDEALARAALLGSAPPGAFLRLEDAPRAEQARPAPLRARPMPARPRHLARPVAGG